MKKQREIDQKIFDSIMAAFFIMILLIMIFLLNKHMINASGIVWMIISMILLIVFTLLYHKRDAKSIWFLFFAMVCVYASFFCALRKGLHAPYELRYYFDQISVIVIMISCIILVYRLLYLAYLRYRKTKEKHGKIYRFFMMSLGACGIVLIAYIALISTFMLSFEIPKETVIENAEERELLEIRETNASENEIYYATADNPFIRFKRDDESKQKRSGNNEAPSKPNKTQEEETLGF